MPLKSLAKELNTKCLIYCGISGHDKGLVDVMISFGAVQKEKEAF